MEKRVADLLDRSKQRDLLWKLASAYPETVDAGDLDPICPGNGLRVNIAYLQEHGLVDAKFQQYIDLGTQLTWGKITAKGIDFIADDGGLGAILNVQTIRLHEDSVRALLIKQVEASDVSQSVKERLVDKLKSMPADGIGTITEKALEAGLKALPNVAHWLQALL
ncbi:hypothetical protein N799_04985 [Lysobacter arseniciresistens ZS79]|uniref:Uncharacterized protein n=1 Tax=Lysobacter arseniciresistens ZS79 TaxID=913325 RepID=A0A0A0F1E9_9GAMM|nr:hypothetical protein N799_04985 [Lysobacter arseniciresistens ZS79]